MIPQPHQNQSGIACEECRRKRIRCDKKTPQCSACATSGTNCVVRDSYLPRGPKKGYLKTLQKKIEELQAQLDKQQGAPPSAEIRVGPPTSQDGATTPNNNAGSPGYIDVQGDVLAAATTAPMTAATIQGLTATAGFQFPLLPLEPWAGIDGSYPNLSFPTLDQHQEPPAIAMDAELNISPMMHNDLDQLYFDRAYVFAPIVQAHRYRSWSKQLNKSRERVCLQHAMWTLASSLSSQFQIAGCQLYAETRKLLHALESGEPQHQLSIEQAQAWTLLATYELMCEDYHRGMMSAGRAFRLIQMLRLYAVDVPRTPPTTGLRYYDHCQLSPQVQEPEDWVDIEMKRRTFWLAYILDRFTSTVEGLHMFFDEWMIRTCLPAPEAEFASGRPTEIRCYLSDMIRNTDREWPENDSSSFTETIIVATLCGQVLEHKQRSPVTICSATDTTFEFCRRHRALNTLLAQRIKMLRKHGSLERMGPILTFTALAAYIPVLMLYDIIESNPLGTEGQAAQLTKALRNEQQQQSMDAVTGIVHLVSALGQHFQTHPLTPILLLLCGWFSQAYPGLNDAHNKLMPGLITTLQASTNLNRLAQKALDLLGPQNNAFNVFA